MKKFKNYLALCLAVGITFTNVYAVSITDVASTHWAYKAIADIQEKGILTVNSKGEFKPNEKMNYFEFMIALARATGYKNPSVDTTIEQTLRDAILKNEEKQMPIVDSYAEKYTAWDKSANESIAYLLGRGYIKTTDLDKFVITNTSGSEVKKMLTKQDLATYIVRMLQKEETAKAEFAKLGSTGFADENLITSENKANVAYLKAEGLVSGDGSNLFGANTYATRAICAKMISEGLAKQGASVTPSEETALQDAVLKKVLEKNSTEYYVLLEQDGKTKFYTIEKDSMIQTSNGGVAINKVALDTPVSVKIEMKNNIDYIVQCVVKESSSSTNNDTNNTPNTIPETIVGTLERVGSNNDLSLTDSTGKLKTYMIDEHVKISSSDKILKLEDVNIGSMIKVFLSEEIIVQVEVLQNVVTDGKIQGDIEAKTISKDSLLISVKTSNKTVDIQVPYNVNLTRNSKKAEILDLRVGDKVEIAMKDNLVESVKATSTIGKSTGKIKEIKIAARPTITIETVAGDKTFSITSETEIYDNSSRTNITLGGLKLGQEVELMIDSKEILSVVIQEGSAKLNYKAVIQGVGKGNKSIDVVVDYDPLTGQNMAFKRINVPVEVKISRNGVDEHRSILQEGMELVITFDGYQDFVPEKIMVLN